MKNITSLNASIVAVASENTVTAVGTASLQSSVSDKTTLKELIDALGSITELPKKPTPKALRENEEVIAESDGCIVYGNGYAVYKNDSGETTVFLNDCHIFTQGDSKTCVDDYSWIIGVSARGETQIEENVMNRKGDRKGTRASEEEVDKDQDYDEHDDGKPYRPYHFPSPEQVYIHKETIRENLDRLTKRQCKIYLLYHYYGYNEKEIGKMLGITQQGVHNSLSVSDLKIHKNLFD